MAEGGLIQTRGEIATPCTLSGHWWVDIDAIDSAYPGSFWANHPITVLLEGNHFPTTSSLGTGIAWYSLRAQMIKR